MKKILLFLACAVALAAPKAKAAITVTPGTGGTNICANLAVGGLTPAYTTLGNIVVTEGLNADFTNGFHTLTINAPTGWQFNTGAAPTVTNAAGGNITFIFTSSFTTTALSVSFFANNTTLHDAITISGLQVQATSSGAAAGNITASAAAGMTGITTGTTNFGSLSLTPSLTPSVTNAASPAGTICSGTSVTFTATPTNGGTPTYQWYVAGSPVAGATNSTFTSSTLANGNTVRVIMTPTGCVNATTVNSNTITMSVNATPATVTVSGGGTFCNSATLTATLAGIGTIYYQGTTYNGTSTATPSSTQNITAPGTYTYFFRARSGAGCWGNQGSASVTINNSPSGMTISPTSTPSMCIGDSGTFVATATAPSVELMSQDFNSGLGSWTITNIAGIAASYFQLALPPGHISSTPGDGTQYVQSAPDATGSSSLPTHTILTSPSFSLVNYTAASLSFNQYYFAFTQDTTVNVEYSIDGGTTWVPFVVQAGSTAGTPSWTAGTPNLTVALPAATLGQSDVRLRWNYLSAWGWYWTVDNIKVFGTPTLSYTWTAAGAATGLSCTACDTTTITPDATGTNNYFVVTSVSGCADTGVLAITVNPLPTLYNVTGGGSYCAGDIGTNVGLDGSDAGVDYQLYNTTGAAGAAMAGTGAALDFGPQTVASSYFVVATNGTTGCSDTMSGMVNVVVNPLPTAFNVTGGTTICAGDTGVHIGLSGSEMGVTYQLYETGTPVGAAVAGTGSSLDFGLYAAAGSYHVVGTNDTTMCMADMADTATLVVNALPVVAPITGTTTLCTGGSTTLSSATTGGMWSSSNPTVATIDGTGMVSAITAGTTTITYSVTDMAGCTGMATTDDTVMAAPTSGIMPAGPYVTMCNSTSVNLVATSIAGATYQWTVGGSPIAGATDNSYTATATGVYAVSIDNGVCAWTLPSRTVLPDPVAVIGYNVTGNYLYTGSFATYQWYLHGSPIAGATSSILLSPISGDYTVVVTDAGGCSDTSAVFNYTATGVANVSATSDIKVYPNPASSVINVTAAVPVTVTVLSPDGRVVIPETKETRINVDMLPAGVYLLLARDMTGELLKTVRFTRMN